MKRALMFLLAVAVVFMCTSSIAVADCSDKRGVCFAIPECSYATCGEIWKGSMDYGTCWSWGAGCKPCHSQETYRRECKEKFAPGGTSTLGCNCTHWYFSFRDQNGNEIDN